MKISFTDNIIGNDLISVIVPVYNVEAYLPKCLDSIINQTYSNIEIILIDDGSTDKSGCICDEYSEKDKRIIAIHKVNGGAASARNKGLNIARGEYISFVDADDFILSDMLQIMLELSKEHKSDVVCCAYNDLAYPDGKKHSEFIESDKYGDIDKADAVRHALIDSDSRIFNPAVWNKIYKRKCISTLRFPEGYYYEDLCFLIEAFCKADKITIINRELYCYNSARGDNMTNTINFLLSDKGKRSVRDKLALLKVRSDTIRENGFTDLFIYSYINFLLHIMKFYCFYRNKDSELTGYCQNLFEQEYDCKLIKQSGLIKRWRINLFKKKPEIYFAIYNATAVAKKIIFKRAKGK